MLDFYKVKLKPITTEEVELASTPVGQRTLLQVHALHNPLVHAVYQSAEYLKLSTEDRMTVLAFNTLLHLEVMQEEHLKLYEQIIAYNYF